jgi:hypothetical protein
VLAQEVDVSQRSGAGRDASVEVSPGSEAAEYTPSGSGGLPLARNPFNFVVSISGGYDDNASASQGDSDGSLFTRASVAVTYSFVGPRFQGTLATDAAFDYYFGGEDNEYRPNAHLNGTLGYAVSERLMLNTSAAIRYHSDPEISLVVSPDRASNEFWYYSASLAASYVWLPRFTTVTSYSISAVDYVDSDDAIVPAPSNFTNSVGQQARFLFLPETSITADYSISQTTYEENTGSDSLSQSVLAGIDHTIGPRLRGSLRAGVQFYSVELFGGLLEINRTSPHVESNLNYGLGSSTSLAWNSRYSIESSNFPGTAGPTTFRTGLEVTHSLTARISATASGYYRHDAYEQDPFFGGAPDQEAFDGSVRFSYAFNPRISASLDYHRTELQSGDGINSYSRNRYLFGIQANF